MAIARAAPGAKLLTFSTGPFCRLYSTASSSQNTGDRRPRKNGNLSRWSPSEEQATGSPRAQPQTQPRNGPNSIGKKPKAKQPFMAVPSAAKKFASHNGRLKTTPENWAFLQENHIEYDNSIARKIDMGVENTRIINDFTTRAFWSPRHILHPHHLQYLDPRDHPLGEAYRAKYRRKVREEPLWVIMMDQNDDVGLTRSMAKRRLTAAFWTSLKELGYERFPEPGAPQIRGTLLVKIANAKAAANFPASRFGEAAAAAVEKQWKMEQKKRESKGSDAAATTQAQELSYNRGSEVRDPVRREASRGEARRSTTKTTTRW